ncbi:hypothetical protein [Desulfogranum japonicum]|uniref:hypothetical protein n=1 Tax=Desulfogranum japonicum TaxID=231447 RepID=UPI0004152936|nr:hypothetical protein [Desulfogranum japonicum]
MPLLLGPLVAWIGSVAGRFVTDSLLKFAAYKLLAFTIITVTLPVVLKNIINWFFKTIFDVISANMPTYHLQDVSFQLTGLLGWLCEQMMIPDCLSILAAAMAFKMVLKLIPFIG